MYVLNQSQFNKLMKDFPNIYNELKKVAYERKQRNSKGMSEINELMKQLQFSKENNINNLAGKQME